MPYLQGVCENEFAPARIDNGWDRLELPVGRQWEVLPPPAPEDYLDLPELPVRQPQPEEDGCEGCMGWPPGPCECKVFSPRPFAQVLYDMGLYTADELAQAQSDDFDYDDLRDPWDDRDEQAGSDWDAEES